MDTESALSNLRRALIAHEDGTELPNDDTPGIGMAIADEVLAQIREGLWMNDLPARLRVAQGMTSFDLGAYLRRYPNTFTQALGDPQGALPETPPSSGTPRPGDTYE